MKHSNAVGILTLLSLPACYREPTSVGLDDARLMVYAVLHNDAETVTAFIARSALDPDSAPDPVLDASARLVYPGGTITLSRTGTCISEPHIGIPIDPALNGGCYSGALPGGLQPGAVYDLEVDVPGEPPVRGTTRVPPALTLREPAPGTEMPYDTVLPGPGGTEVRVHWSGVESDSYVELRLSAADPECTAEIRAPAFSPDFAPSWLTGVVGRVGVDTVTVKLERLHCGTAAPQRQAGQLVVTVYDSSYTRYMTLDHGALWIPDASIGIAGAIGLFGAAVTRVVPVVLVPR